MKLDGQSVVRTGWARRADCAAMAAVGRPEIFGEAKIREWQDDPLSILIIATMEAPDPEKVCGWMRVSLESDSVIAGPLFVSPAGAGDYTPADILRFLMMHLGAIANRRHADRVAIVVDHRQVTEATALASIEGAARSMIGVDLLAGELGYCFGFRVFRDGRFVPEQYYARKPEAPRFF